MSKEVEEKVVEMRFDNRNFENNVATTMSTLERLKQRLNFSDAVQSFDDISSAARNTSLDPLSSAVEVVHDKFSRLEVIAIAALTNIANSAINTGRQLVASLTTDQIAAGFTKYEDKTKAVQTIMSATGMSIEDVNKELKKLSWFTDETSYNFTDMVSNIGKFTSVGVDLDKSVTAMEGIANWAALSGQGVNEASRAMNNLSQALSMGSVQVMDWKSIELANMGTKEFKETAIETAKAMGLLDKEGKDAKGNLVDYLTFRDTLKDDWFTSDVLIETLKKYGEYSDAVYGIVAETGMSCAEAMEKVNGETMKLGERAFKAGQEAKTLSEALDATKDAVSSGWMDAFEIIFGNYEEAKSLWTDLTADLWEIFASDFRHEDKTTGFLDILDAWKDQGGRDALIKSFKNIMESLLQTIEAVKSAFRDIFPQKSADDLMSLTKRFEKFTEKLKMSDETFEKVKSTLKGFFAIFSMAKQVISGVFQVIKPLFDSLFSKSSGSILNTTDNIGEFLTALSESGKIAEFFTEKFKKLSDVFGIIGKVIDDVFTQSIVSFYEGGGGLGGIIEIVFDSVNSALRGFFEIVEKLTGFDLSGLTDGITGFLRNVRNHIVDFVNDFDKSKIGEKITGFFDNVKGFFDRFRSVDTSGLDSLSDKIGSFWERIKNALEPAKEFFEKTWEFLKTFFQRIKDALSGFFEGIDFGDVAGVVDTGLLAGIAYGIKKFIDSLKDVVESGTSIKDSICGVLDGLKGSLEAMQKDIQSKSILRIAGAVALLALALVELSQIDEDKLSTSLIAISTMFGELMGSMAIIGKMSNSESFSFDDLKKIATSMIIMAAAVAILAHSMEELSKLSLSQIGKGLLAIGGLLGEMVGAVALLDKIFPNPKRLEQAAKSMVVMAVAIAILASSMEKLGSLDMATIGKGLLAIGVLLGEIVGAIALLDKISPSGLISTSVGILIIAAAMAIMVPVLKSFGNMSWEAIGKGLVAVGGSLLIFAGAAALMKKALPGAVAIMIIAASLLLLVPVLKILGSMSTGEIVKALVLIAGALGIMIGAAYLAKPVIAVILALGVAIALLGVGCLGVGAGLLMLTLALDSLAVAAPVVVLLITKVVRALIDLIPYVVEKIGEGILSLIKLIGDSATEIAASIIKVVVSVVAMLRIIIPMVVELLLDLIVAILEGIDKNIGKIVELLLSILINIINGIANKIGGLIDAFMNFIEKYLNGVADAIENHGENIFLAIRRILKNILKLAKKVVTTMWEDIKKLGKRIVDGLKEGIGDKIKDVKDKIKEVANAVISKIKEVLGIKSPSTVFKEIGEWLIEGFINGIKEKILAVKDAIEGVANTAVEKLKSFLGIESPSKEFAKIGRYSMEGMALGVTKYSNVVMSSLSEVGKDSIFALQDTFARISDFIDGDLDCQPTIRPVMDLSDIQNGTNRMNRMFGDRYVNLSTETANALSSDISSEMNARTLVKENELLGKISDLLEDMDSRIGNEEETVPFVMNIENFNNNTDQDIEQLTDELSVRLATKINRKKATFR